MKIKLITPFSDLTRIEFWRRGPLTLRLILACAVCAYFPLASLPLYAPLNAAAGTLSAAAHSLLFPGKADMGGMETFYEEHDGGVFAQNPSTDGAAQNTADEPAALAGEGVFEPEEFSVSAPLIFFAHTLERGDMIGNLAIKYGLNEGTLISLNGIRNTRAIQAGRELKIPNQDGIMHKVAAGETIDAIAKKYDIKPEPLVSANELFSEKINAGTNVFVPGAKMPESALQEINGDLFIRPIRGRFTSAYGWRRSPITDVRSFHRGIDLAAPQGTPIGAGMAGRVTSVGYSPVFGNYVIISHHSNYRTLYAHMSSVKTRTGAFVSTGQTVGYVGNTGQSTGPHLHFEVYKNGVTVNPMLLMH